VNLSAFLYLLLFAALAVVAWRRFGAPYGLFAALSLVLPLSVPSERWPLLSLPRFGLVVFPLFLALAVLTTGRPRLHTGAVAVGAILLGISVVQWATWQWVA
jgi:hypothetical protein